MFVHLPKKVCLVLPKIEQFHIYQDFIAKIVVFGSF